MDAGAGPASPAEPDPAEVAALALPRAARSSPGSRTPAPAPAAIPPSVTLVAVTQDRAAPSRLRAAVAAGLDVLGENRVQEAAAKVAARRPAPRWHLVGPLQSNKARRAVETVRRHRDGRLGRARRGGSTGLARASCRRPVGRARCPVLLQVNVDDDPAKAGFAPDELAAALPALARPRRASRSRGLMTIGRLVDDADEAARRRSAGCASWRDRLRRGRPAPRARAVDGHERRLRGRGRGGRHDRPGRPGALRRAAAADRRGAGDRLPRSGSSSGSPRAAAPTGSTGWGTTASSGPGSPRRRSTAPPTRRSSGSSPTSSTSRRRPSGSSRAPRAGARRVAVDGRRAGGDPCPLAGPRAMIGRLGRDARRRSRGDWLSRLERAVHIREVTGSNPVSPTTSSRTIGPPSAAAWSTSRIGRRRAM